MKARNKSKKPKQEPKARNTITNYVHQKTPLFVQKGTSGGYGEKDADGSIGGDPFLKITNPQFVSKRDYSRHVLPYVHCDARSVYSAASGASATTGMRILWSPPLIIKQSKANAVPEADPRGNFGDIGSTLISFKNLLKQPIQIAVNSPRARIEDPNKTYVRRYKKELLVKPGQIKFYRLDWGDKANIFTPRVVYVPDASSTPNITPCFEIADFIVVVPTQDEMSGLTFDQLKAMDAVEVHVSQQYIATSQYGGGVTVKERPIFLYAKLGNYAEFINEAAVAIPTTLPSLMRINTMAGNLVLSEDWGVQDGVKIMLHGFPQVFKAVDGKMVLWDIDTDKPSNDFSDVVFPKGVGVVLLTSDELTLTFNEVIGFLTTVTKILTVVAAFL